jgi:hypothetical protein
MAMGRTLVPGVIEGEAALISAASVATQSTVTAPLAAPLLTAAQALPVAAGVGVAGAGAGHLTRAAAREGGASEPVASTIGFGSAITLTMSHLTNFIYPILLL